MQKIINSANNSNNNKKDNNSNNRPQYFVPDNIRAPAVSAFAARLGGVSGVEGDSAYSLNLGFRKNYDKDKHENESVLQNYKIIADELGFSVNNIIYAHQKHTDNILICDNNFAKSELPRLAEIKLPLPENYIYDAMVTDIPGILLSVRSADCVPVLFWDAEHNAVGAAHCGWRGTIQKLQVKTALKMRELYNTDLRKLKAAIGPCISKCCYEVSKEFFENFADTLGGGVKTYFEEKPGGKYHCDLKGVNKMLLESVFIENENIEVSQNCTCCEELLFFSHRRQGEIRGTHASFIGVKQ